MSDVKSMVELKITAIGEVRDAEGNLLSTTPVEFTQVMTAEEARAFQEGIK